MDGKLSERTTPNGAVELLVSLAILWRRPGRSTALCLPDKYCQYQEGGAQHFSGESIGPERVLAATCLGSSWRKASSRTGSDCRGRLMRGALRLLRRRRSVLLDTALGGEINCKTAEP